MPIYEFLCDCGHTGTFHKPMGDNDQDCPYCDRKMRRILSPCRINMGVGAYGYYDDQLETYIESNQHHRDVMRQKNVCHKGDTPKPDGQSWV